MEPVRIEFHPDAIIEATAAREWYAAGMAASRKRRIVRRIMLSVAIPAGIAVWYLVSVLCIRGGCAAGWISTTAPYADALVMRFNVPLVWYIETEKPGGEALRWLVVQTEIVGTRFHPSQKSPD